jgi:competence protein ComEC
LLVLLADPLALFSPSFQMSYGVVLTILCLGLPLTERLQARWRPFAYLPEAVWAWWQRGLAGLLRWLAAALGIGLAALLVSMVTGAAFFHVFAPVGLAANLVLMPLAMLVIIAGVASIAVGQAGAAALGALFNHAAVVVLWGMEAFIRLGVRVPGAWWPVTFRAAWIGPAALTALLAACLAGYALHWRPAAGGFWVPPALAALTLILGVKFG